MLLTKNRKVESLEEDLKDMGLNPEKFLGATDRMSSALTEGAEGNGTWKGAPPVARYGYGPNASAHVEEEQQLLNEDVQVQPGELTELELLRTGKSQAQRKASARQTARKRKGDAKAQAALRVKKRLGKRASVKRKRARARKKVARSMSATRKAALNRAGVKVFARKRFDGEPTEEQISEEIANWSEEQIAQALSEDTDYQAAKAAFEALPAESPFFDAACYVEDISDRFVDLFDLAGEKEASRVMEALRGHAATLAEELDGVTELDEDQGERLAGIVGQVAKAIRFYEAMGEPTLTEAVAYAAYVEGDSGLTEDDDLSEVSDEDDEVTEDDDLEEVGDGDDDGGGPGNGELAEV